MRDEIPTLTADERALLHRFRVDESPEPAVAARVLRGLSAQLGATTPAIDRPWWLWLRAGGLSVAIAACGLLVLGGTARVLAPRPGPSATEAMDVAAPTTTPRSTEPAPTTVAPAIATPPAIAIPEAAHDCHRGGLLRIDPERQQIAAPVAVGVEDRRGGEHERFVEHRVVPGLGDLHHRCVAAEHLVHGLADVGRDQAELGPEQGEPAPDLG